ncbi:hypothetical protein O181_099098 [Austropuccinia psidii MF-1]|uniref:Uncharacterized protein n=1 Tax=Austropuccinia psidii MF-1 TaxID=1389203 RepID=A0A9Q3PET5_9BASI|nr:hypothetical protein [Austropuccinia psidii MF-1]
MKDITTRRKIGRNGYKPSIDNKKSAEPISRPNKPQDKAPLKCNKCGIKSCLANTCPKKTRIIGVEIEKTEDPKEKIVVSVNESDSEPSEEGEPPDQLSIENLNVSF